MHNIPYAWRNDKKIWDSQCVIVWLALSEFAVPHKYIRNTYIFLHSEFLTAKGYLLHILIRSVCRSILNNHYSSSSYSILTLINFIQVTTKDSSTCTTMLVLVCEPATSANTSIDGRGSTTSPCVCGTYLF